MKKQSLSVVVLLFCVSLFIVGCSLLEGTPAGHSDPHWTYEGAEGPEHWGDLGEEYALCSSGREQSPINLTDATGGDLQDIVFNYGDSAVKILHNGHTIQVNYDDGSSIQANGKSYDLNQFHFHVASEHSINNQFSDAELHLVHMASDNSRAVVGVMINVGADNEALATVWDNLPAQESPETTIPNVRVNAADLLPDSPFTYYTYPGSLTTPPCDQGITWFVLTTPIEMSAEQIERFKTIIEVNNRPVQELNGRLLQEDTTTGN